MAVDDDPVTYWQSEKTSGRLPLPAEWMVVELGQEASLIQIGLVWDRYYATEYAIMISQDNVNWTTVFDTTTGDGENDAIPLQGVSARYVMFYSTGWSNRLIRCWLDEIQIYGTYTGLP